MKFLQRSDSRDSSSQISQVKGTESTSKPDLCLVWGGQLSGFAVNQISLIFTSTRASTTQSCTKTQMSLRRDFNSGLRRFSERDQFQRSDECPSFRLCDLGFSIRISARFFIDTNRNCRYNTVYTEDRCAGLGTPKRRRRTWRSTRSASNSPNAS